MRIMLQRLSPSATHWHPQGTGGAEAKMVIDRWVLAFRSDLASDSVQFALRAGARSSKLVASAT